MLVVERGIHCLSSHVIVDSSPYDMHGRVRTQHIEQVKREQLAGPIFVRRGFLDFCTLEGHTGSIKWVILGGLPKAKIL